MAGFGCPPRETGSGPVTSITDEATVTYDGTTPLASAYSLTIDDIQDYTLATLPTVGNMMKTPASEAV
jgi:hypothetical protein